MKKVISVKYQTFPPSALERCSRKRNAAVCRQCGLDNSPVRTGNTRERYREEYPWQTTGCQLCNAATFSPLGRGVVSSLPPFTQAPTDCSPSVSEQEKPLRHRQLSAEHCARHSRIVQLLKAGKEDVSPQRGECREGGRTGSLIPVFRIRGKDYIRYP